MVSKELAGNVHNLRHPEKREKKDSVWVKKTALD